MNILFWSYAVEVEKTHSFTQAAQNLFISQPHLSKSIKDLENALGIKLFDRSSRGVYATEEGAEFLSRVKAILKEVEETELMFKPKDSLIRTINISAPRATFVCEAFINYAKDIIDDEFDLNYCESNSIQAIDNVESKKAILQ